MTQTDKIRMIHTSILNGKRRQAVAQIDAYGHYDFWPDYVVYLERYYYTDRPNGGAWAYLKDAVVSYHRIKAR